MQFYSGNFSAKAKLKAAYFNINRCLVFLAAFIGLYFVIEIQAKSKIAEGS